MADEAGGQAPGLDWVLWHRAYEGDTPLRRRLGIVQGRIREALGRCPPGPIRAVSVCAGQGRDLIGALAGHPRRGDVTARLVELDPRNVAEARSAAAAAGLSGIAALQGDASNTAVYAGALAADLLLVCGVFGNISEADIARTIATLPSLCAAGATVIWTRHRRPPDRTPWIREAFVRAGFEELALDAPEGDFFSVGTARLAAPPAPYVPDVAMFRFVGYPALLARSERGAGPGAR
jgi:Putative methyltransferase